MHSIAAVQLFSDDADDIVAMAHNNHNVKKRQKAFVVPRIHRAHVMLSKLILCL